MDEKKKRKVNIKWIIAAAVVLVVIAVIAVVLILNGGISGLVNAIAGSPVEVYYYERSGNTVYAPVGRGLAVLSTSQLSVYSQRGEETLSRLVSFSQPELSASGDWAAAWDLGGREIIVFSERGLRHRITMDETVVSVSVNSSGYVAVAAEEKGYGGAATVYNPDGKAIYKAYSGTKYVLSAKMRGRTELLVLSIGGGESELTLYDVTSEAVKARYTIEGLLIEADFNASGFTAVSEEGLIFLNGELKPSAEYGFGGKYLLSYRLGERYAAVALAEYRLGGARQAAVVSLDGTVKAELTTEESIQWMESSSGAVTLLTGGKIWLMTEELKLRQEFEAPAGTVKVLLRDSATVIAVGDYSAAVLTAEK